MPNNPPTRPPWERSRPSPKPPSLHGRGGPIGGTFREDIFVGDPLAWVAERSPAFVASEVPQPRPIEVGPMEFSTSVGLEPWPLVVWDVNAYYAELGVSFRASRKEIRDAYQRLHGEESDRLTYIVQQLLDPGVRAMYDACQPGAVFFDRYIAAFVKDQILKDQVTEHGRILSFDEQASLEYSPIDLSKFMNQPFDTIAAAGHNVSHRWRWGFYLWATDDYNTDKLRQWQGLLIAALARKGVVLKLSIGLIGGSNEPVKVEAVGYRVVVFLDDTETPTLSLAESVVDQVVNTAASLQVERINRYV